MRAFLMVLTFLLGIYAAFCLFVFLTQRSQIYFPVPESWAPVGEAMQVDVDGARLKVWAVPRPGPAALLYFGGNAEDVAASVAPFSTLLPAHSMYFVNYRGYGGSTGSPSEEALVADAIALHDRLRPLHPELCVMGRSLGSGVAMQLAAVRDVPCLVLVTPFDSLANVARHHFRWLPVGLLLRDRYNSTSRAGEIAARSLVVIAGNDEIIPRARSEALVAALPAARTRVIVLEGARHNDLDASPGYLPELRRFLSE